MKNMNRKRALEDFLNDTVEQKALGLYLWRERYYEVLTTKQTLRRHNWSQFVTIGNGYKMREANEYIIKTYYPKVLTNN